MPFYSDIMQDGDPERAAAYKNYLVTVSAHLPDETREFLLSDWYYSDVHRCPHDAWVESLEIFEDASGTGSKTVNSGFDCDCW
jgi:hypothetical protein